MSETHGRPANASNAENSSMANIEIRLATDGDLPHLVRLMADMDDQEVDLQDGTATQTMRETLAMMAQYPDFKAWLVLEAGRPVASYSLMLFCSPSHHGTRQALLDAVVVQHDRRGSGLGALMLAHAMDQATSAGCYKLMLSSNLKRADAHRFYETLGFRQHGISFSIDLVDSGDRPVLQQGQQARTG